MAAIQHRHGPGIRRFIKKKLSRNRASGAPGGLRVPFKSAMGYSSGNPTEVGVNGQFVHDIVGDDLYLVGKVSGADAFTIVMEA